MKGIPKWVAGWLVILAVAGIGFGLFELLNPGAILELDVEANAADTAARQWGGRNLALGVCAVLALLLRERGAFSVALAGAIAREGSDVFTALVEDQSIADIALPAVMGVIDVVAFLGVLGSAVASRRKKDDITPPTNFGESIA